MNRLLWCVSVVLACASPAADNTRPPPPGSLDTVLIAGHALYVPRGFTVNLFAEGLNGVRCALGAPRARVLHQGDVPSGLSG